MSDKLVIIKTGFSNMQKHPSADKTGEPINSKKIGSCNTEL